MNYGYLSVAGAYDDYLYTSMVPDTYTDSTGTYKYYYDANYNITKIEKNGNVVATYAYDALNQLIREDIAGNYTYVYTYDNGGNRLTTKRYTYTPAGTAVSGSGTTIGRFNEFFYRKQLILIIRNSDKTTEWKYRMNEKTNIKSTEINHAVFAAKEIK